MLLFYGKGGNLSSDFAADGQAIDLVLRKTAIAHDGIEDLLLDEIAHHYVAHVVVAEGKSAHDEQILHVGQLQAAYKRKGEHGVLFGIHLPLNEQIPELRLDFEQLSRALRRFGDVRKHLGQKLVSASPALKRASSSAASFCRSSRIQAESRRAILPSSATYSTSGMT